MTYAIAFLMMAAVVGWAAELWISASRAEHVMVLRLPSGGTVLLARQADGRFDIVTVLGLPGVLARFEAARMIHRGRVLRALTHRTPRPRRAPVQAH